MQTPTREQLFPSGVLFTAIRTGFPETVTQLILHLLHPGIHTDSSLRKCLRNSLIIEHADALARGEFADYNVLSLASLVAQATSSHLFLHGPQSTSLTSGPCTETIALDAVSQSITNRCIDAFIFHAIGISKAFSTWWHDEGKCALVCIIGIPGASLYDAELSPAALARLSLQLRLLLAKISEAVRQGAQNFPSLNFSTAMGEAMSNLITVSKQCFRNLESTIGLSRSTLYDKVDQPLAAEYSRECFKANSNAASLKSASISTPSKRREAIFPDRPSKRQFRKGRGVPSSDDESSGHYLPSNQESLGASEDEHAPSDADSDHSRTQRDDKKAAQQPENPAAAVSTDMGLSKMTVPAWGPDDSTPTAKTSTSRKKRAAPGSEGESESEPSSTSGSDDEADSRKRASSSDDDASSSDDDGYNEQVNRHELS